MMSPNAGVHREGSKDGIGPQSIPLSQKLRNGSLGLSHMAILVRTRGGII
jgi:hypothetical protein